MKKNTMTIGLDFDGTVTEDPELWLAFIRTSLQQGHYVYIVTMRFESEICDLLKAFGAVTTVIFTGRKAKDAFCKSMGINVNVWIDDHPAAVIMDADQIWQNVLPEGQILTANAQSNEHKPLITE